MTNCPNCGSPIDIHECMCKYCGTYYFDLTAFDIDSDKKYYIKFKQKIPFGDNVIVTALVRPFIEEINQRSDTIDVFYDNDGVIVPNAHCDIFVRFSCMRDPKTGKLFREERNKK